MRGRAPRGERCRAAVPRGNWKTTTFLTTRGLVATSTDVSPAGMTRRQQAVIDMIARDPTVANATGYIGAGGHTVTENNGRLFILLKPPGERKATAGKVIRRLDIALKGPPHSPTSPPTPQRRRLLSARLRAGQ